MAEHSNEELWHERRISLLLFFIPCILFWPSVWYRFTLDDSAHILRNVDIRTWAGIRESFLLPMFPGNLFRPFPIFTYGVTYQIFGLNPFPYHVTNVLLHCLISFFVYFLFRKRFSVEFSSMVSLLFAVHPVHTEAIVNITNRTELLCHLFGISLLLFVTSEKYEDAPLTFKEKCFYIFSVFILSLFSFLSKESGLSYIILIPLYRMLLGVPVRRLFRSLDVGLILSLIVYVCLRMKALGGGGGLSSPIDFLDNPLAHLSVWERIVNAFILLGEYIRLFIIPFPLSSDYSYAAMQISTNLTDVFLNQRALISSMLLFILFLLLIWGLLKERKVFFFNAWFFVGISIVSNILMPIGTIFAERLLYLPSIGLSGLVVMGFERLFRRSFVYIVCLVCVLFIYLSSLYSGNWKENKTLHTYQITRSPQSAKTQSNYGTVLRIKKDFDGASLHYRNALAIYPKFAEAAYGLAAVYLDQGSLSGMEHWLKESLSMNPDFAPSLLLLGRKLMKDGRYDDAKRQFEKVLEVDGRNYEAKLGLLAVLINLKDFTHVDTLISELQRRDPENRELHYLMIEYNKRTDAPRPSDGVLGPPVDLSKE